VSTAGYLLTVLHYAIGRRQQCNVVQHKYFKHLLVRAQVLPYCDRDNSARLYCSLAQSTRWEALGLSGRGAACRQTAAAAALCMAANETVTM
jgi:hypothetical protein